MIKVIGKVRGSLSDTRLVHDIVLDKKNVTYTNMQKIINEAKICIY